MRNMRLTMLSDIRGACRVFAPLPPPSRPRPAVLWPAAISAPTTGARRSPSPPPTGPPRRCAAPSGRSADWWRGFRSPDLNRLMAQAEAGNFDIAAAIARVRQADAAVRIAGASLLPSLSATAGTSLTQEGLGSRSFSTPGAAWQRRGDAARIQRRPQRRLSGGFLGPLPGRSPVGRGQRRVQPLRRPDRGAHRSDERRPDLVHRARRCRPAGRGAPQSRRRRAIAAGDSGAARRRHGDGAGSRPAGARWSRPSGRPSRRCKARSSRS